MVHGSSAYLFRDNRIEVRYKFGYEFVLEVFLDYRCARARDEVGALSGNNVEEVLQISHCRQFDGPQCKPESKEGTLTMSRSGLALVVGGLPGRDVMASDGFAQMRHELAVFARVKFGKVGGGEKSLSRQGRGEGA